MEIILSKVLPENVVNQVMMYKATKLKDNWSDIIIKDVNVRFVSKKDHCIQGWTNYFKITDEIVKTERFLDFVDRTNYGPIWKPGHDYMIGVTLSRTERSNPVGPLSVDLKFHRYTDYRVGDSKGICYHATMFNMRDKQIKTKLVVPVSDDPFAD